MLGKTRIHQSSEAYHEGLERIFDIAHPTKLLRHSPVKVRKVIRLAVPQGDLEDNNAIRFQPVIHNS